MNRSGRRERLTSRGSENVAPDWGPNGLIAYCSRREGRYGVHVIDPSSREDRPISPSDAQYEDPSWAPDGRHLACTRTEGYRSTIYLLDTLGDGPLCIVGEAGDWSSPAWTWR
jgi:TolB protein